MTTKLPAVEEVQDICAWLCVVGNVILVTLRPAPQFRAGGMVEARLTVPVPVVVTVMTAVDCVPPLTDARFCVAGATVKST